MSMQNILAPDAPSSRSESATGGGVGTRACLGRPVELAVEAAEGVGDMALEVDWTGDFAERRVLFMFALQSPRLD